MKAVHAVTTFRRAGLYSFSRMPAQDTLRSRSETEKVLQTRWQGSAGAPITEFGQTKGVELLTCSKGAGAE